MNATLSPASDHEVVNAMESFGGSFVRSLAALCRRADADNLHIIKTSFAHYWRTYAEMAVEKREAK